MNDREMTKICLLVYIFVYLFIFYICIWKVKSIVKIFQLKEQRSIVCYYIFNLFEKMCRVADCRQQHNAHFCKNCQHKDSDHFSSQCHFQRMPQQNQRNNFNGYQGGNFNGHQGGNFNGYYGGNLDNMGYNMPLQANQYQRSGFGQNSKKIFVPQKSLYGHKNMPYNQNPMQMLVRCRVNGCKQQHPFHYCKNCQNPNSDHKSSRCPLFVNQMQRKPKFSQKQKMNYFMNQKHGNYNFQDKGVPQKNPIIVLQIQNTSGKRLTSQSMEQIKASNKNKSNKQQARYYDSDDSV